MKIKTLLFSGLVLAVSSSADFSFAAEIRVLNCDGTLRASTELLEGETRDIKLILPADESNIKAKIQSAILIGEDKSSLPALGTSKDALIFSSVGNGDWKACLKDDSQFAFLNVEFHESQSRSLKVASLIAGGAAVLSGIAIASEGSASDSPSNNIIESNQPDRTITEEPSSSLQPGKESRPEGEIIIESRCNKKKPSTLAATNEDCREDEDAQIISPFK